MQAIESTFNSLANFGIDSVRPNQDFQKILDANMSSEKTKTTPFANKIFSSELASSNNINSTNADIDALIEQYSAKNGLDSAFVKAVIKQESGFQPKVTSSCGAMGLMQLMPATANSLGVKDAYDPEQNIAGGTKYLKGLLDRFGGDKSLALAAYNAGPNAVAKYNGIPPYKETQNYVKNIMSMYQQYNRGGQS
ncbi:MAG: lytic transglycosylase domain-containing protein [Clostridium sp.]|nr:lytic transglycosylase domain-containing protein [Clostridium sp.]